MLSCKQQSIKSLNLFQSWRIETVHFYLRCLFQIKRERVQNHKSKLSLLVILIFLCVDSFETNRLKCRIACDFSWYWSRSTNRWRFDGIESIEATIFIISWRKFFDVVHAMLADLAVSFDLLPLFSRLAQLAFRFYSYATFRVLCCFYLKL